MRQVPVIDGTIQDAEWQDAVGNHGLVNLASQTINARRAWFWVGRRSNVLFLAMRTEAPPTGILTRVKPDGNRDFLDAFHDDSIEMVLDPKRGRTSGDRMFYHLIFNANEALYDHSVDPDNRANPKNNAWRISGWMMKNTVHDGWWDVEMAIPFASLGAELSDLNTPWGIRLIRNWKRPYAQSQWEYGVVDYNDQSTMPVVVWDDAAPVVQVLSLQKNDQPLIQVSVRNPHATPMDVAVYLQDAWHMDQLRVLKETVKLAANAQEIVALPSVDGGPSGDHRTIINITSPDGKKVYYSRDFRWNMHRPKEVWDIEQRSARQVDLKFKYYPYYNKARIWINVNNLNESNIAAANTAIVGTTEPDKTLWSKRLDFKDGLVHGIVDIPDLPDGRYRLVVGLEGPKAPKEPLTQDFVRQHFEWEHNQLGFSDKVIPPFTPMTVDGSTVGCVLRRLTHGEGGMWNKAVSEDQDILAGPMQWEVTLADGSKPKVVGQPWRVVSRKETEIVGQSVWQAGAMQARVDTQYDYDGMMKCTLTLPPCAAEVKELTLRIPVKNSLATVMHACGDTLRANYAGSVPTGEGKVWDSSRGNKLDIIGTFYPYLWVGDGEHGLCWFADTDRDWMLDDQTPMLDLVRDGQTLWLNVRFITQTGRLDREHAIVFGLQVTPTKPMPDGWRRWMLQTVAPGGRPVSIIGSTLYWGANVDLPYPMGKDFSYFAEFKRMRETGKLDAQTQTFIENWVRKVAEVYPEGSPQFEQIKLHIPAGMRIAAGTPWSNGWRAVPYTNARGTAFLSDEFATFQDEWLNYDFFNRQWSRTGAVAYDVTPSTSFTDCALWYYRNILTCMDGIYWDNLYLSARQDPVVGDGTWTDDHGRVHPELGLFALRDLIKRTAVLLHQEAQSMPASRLPLVSIGHMTNANLVPVLSFLNCTYDWEWHYGADDFQDRFTPELTLAETIGRQVGAWPTILPGGYWTPQHPKYAWLERNRLGVCLVHELWPSDGYFPEPSRVMYEKLYAFGYGLPECGVYNYWQPGHPASVTSSTVVGKTLVISKAGQTLVIVCDYGSGGACQLNVDLSKLGLSTDAVASDWESGQPVRQVASGLFEFELPKHDFKIILVKQP
ncbi:MAG: hypothetical protein IT440_00525 [Phycisphaeraceae bacterium]|nr:hypothetical protein [Phycisphaeraceae bacterium]